MNVKKFYDDKEHLKNFALEMLNHLNVGTKKGLLALKDNIDINTTDVVKVLLILFMNGTNPKHLKLVIEDLIAHSDLTGNEATMVRLFTYYIHRGEDPEKARPSVNLIFGLNIKSEDLHKNTIF